MDPATGAVVSTLPITYAAIVTEHDGRAWVVQESTAALRIDLDTNEIVQTLPVRPQPVVAREAAGALWVTAYGGDSLWRLAP